MNKKQAKLLFVMAGASLAISVYALYIKKSQYKALNDTYNMIRDFSTEYRFANIVEHYDEDDPDKDI